jgi:hypothetical protein
VWAVFMKHCRNCSSALPKTEQTFAVDMRVCYNEL